MKTLARSERHQSTRAWTKSPLGAGCPPTVTVPEKTVKNGGNCPGYSGIGVGVGVAVGTGVGVGTAVAVGTGVGVGTAVAVGTGVGVGYGVAVGAGVGVGELNTNTDRVALLLPTLTYNVLLP